MDHYNGDIFMMRMKQAAVLDERGSHEPVCMSPARHETERPDQRSFLLRRNLRRKILVVLMLMLPGRGDRSAEEADLVFQRSTAVAAVSSGEQTLPPLKPYAPASTSGFRTMIQQWFLNRNSLDQSSFLCRAGNFLQGVVMSPGAVPVRRDSTTDDEGLVPYGFSPGQPVVVVEAVGSEGPLKGRTLYIFSTGDVYELDVTNRSE